VAFFLFEYRSGSLADHDHEIEEARWMPLEQAAEELTYEGEREMVKRAMSRTPADR
jgi:NADH pyrophosphatase NudC (nudix superfamily)